MGWYCSPRGLEFKALRGGPVLKSQCSNQKGLKKKLDLLYNTHVCLNHICFNFSDGWQSEKKYVITFPFPNIKTYFTKAPFCLSECPADVIGPGCIQRYPPLNTDDLVQVLLFVQQNSATQLQDAVRVSLSFYCLKGWIYVYPEQVNLYMINDRIRYTHDMIW